MSHVLRFLVENMYQIPYWAVFRYQFFLQGKQDILQGRLPVSFELAAELGAYVVQCKQIATLTINRTTPSFQPDFSRARRLRPQEAQSRLRFRVPLRLEPNRGTREPNRRSPQNSSVRTLCRPQPWEREFAISKPNRVVNAKLLSNSVYRVRRTYSVIAT